MQKANSQPGNSLSFRWLGINGIELRLDGKAILIDPFLTRPPLVKVILKRMQSEPELVRQHIHPCQSIFITHSHYDHLLDVPEVIQFTGASAYGSPNTCKILSLSGIPRDRFHEIHAGDEINSEPFLVQVFPTHHTRLFFDRLINGQLPKNKLRYPLRFYQYKMNLCYSFRIRLGEIVIQVGPDPHLPADILFISNRNDPEMLQQAISIISPKILIPVHWDNITRPLSYPQRELLLPGGLTLKQLVPLVNEISPSTQVLIPTIFKEYSYGYAR